jgi:hypothetical protein
MDNMERKIGIPVSRTQKSDIQPSSKAIREVQAAIRNLKASKDAAARRQTNAAALTANMMIARISKRVLAII